MNNLFSKSSKRLLEKSSPNLEYLIDKKLDLVLKEQRHQRSDLKDLKLMINKVLIDKHLQEQVDTYFEDSPENEDKEPD